MSDLFSLMDGAADEPDQPSRTPLMMSESQRADIKALFGDLGINAAREQFAVILELTGVRLASVQDLQAAPAQRAIEGLRRRVASSGRVRTGNAWDDREESTWIDRL